MNQTIKEKRETLKQLSAVVKLAIKEGIYNSVNEGLVDLYSKDGHTEIHSFKKWLELGFVVRKGEKALLLWGEPRQSTRQEKNDSQEDDEYKFFPLAYVFSNKQVEKLNQHAKAV